MSDVRTAAQLVSDLLDLVVRDEWSGSIDVGFRGVSAWRHDVCPTCKARETNDSGEYVREHEPGCARHRLILETRAYLEAENVVAEMHGEDPVPIP